LAQLVTIWSEFALASAEPVYRRQAKRNGGSQQRHMRHQQGKNDRQKLGCCDRKCGY
jgi:hypothetical protein